MRKRRVDIVLGLIKGLLAAVVITLVGMLIMAAAVIYLHMSDGAIQITNQVLKILAVALGTILAVGRAKQRGLITGAALGAVYALLGYLMFIFLGNNRFDVTSLLGELTICIAAGAASGVMRVNVPQRKATAR